MRPRQSVQTPSSIPDLERQQRFPNLQELTGEPQYANGMRVLDDPLSDVQPESCESIGHALRRVFVSSINQLTWQEDKADRAENLSSRGAGWCHKAREFLILPSRKAPRWLLPVDNKQINARAFDIYTPYAKSGRIFKAFIRSLIKTGWTGRQRNHLLISSPALSSLELLVSLITGERHPGFSMSLGSPGNFRKLTMQVMANDGTVLGFLKIPLTDCSTEFVRREVAILKRLEHSALGSYTPRLLHSGFWNGTYISFQSPLHGEPGPTALSFPHSKILGTMQQMQFVHKPGTIIVQEVGDRWRKAVPLLSRTWQEMGAEILRQSLVALRNQLLPCGLAHGDFTPWNSRLRAGELCLFDWEWTEEESPVEWDMFHFQVQTASCLRQPLRILFARTTSMISYSLYLLSSVARLAVAGSDAKPAIDYREKVMKRILQEGLYQAK